MSKITTGCYKITNKINNKVYIGATRQSLGSRWNQYLQGYQRGYWSPKQPMVEEDSLLYDMKRYGIENFTFEVIELIQDFKELFEKEKYYIEKYNSSKKQLGYNNRISESENANIEALKESGIKTRFNKGNIPHNATLIYGILNNEKIIFQSFNKARDYIIENNLNEDLNENQVLYRIQKSCKNSLKEFNVQWGMVEDGK